MKPVTKQTYKNRRFNGKDASTITPKTHNPIDIKPDREADLLRYRELKPRLRSKERLSLEDWQFVRDFEKEIERSRKLKGEMKWKQHFKDNMRMNAGGVIMSGGV